MTTGRVAFVLCALFAGCDMVTADTIRENANTDARAHARRFHPRWSHYVADCQGVDSDGDGYVTCTIGDGDQITEAIECRTAVVMDYQRGCRPMRSVINQPR